MKNKIAILSSLVCMLGIPAQASECIGDGCDIGQIIYEPTVLAAADVAQPMPYIPQSAEPVEYVYAAPQIPMRQVKLLSIKPVDSDARAPLWDGTDGKYIIRTSDKTVDSRDGMPIWDDSVVNYRDKDFADWFLEPRDELYIRDITPPDNVTVTDDVDPVMLYQQNMLDAAATRARIDEILSGAPQTAAPCTTPAKTDEYISDIQTTFVSDDGCPFETETECNIWRRKPIVRETVSPRSPKIRDDKMAEFLYAAQCNPTITANDTAAAPLLARYKMLMQSANACCTDGMAHALQRAGASDGLIYKFMADDANFYGFGARCLMMTDKELDAKYPNTATASVAADVRNGCLCRGRGWFTAMLAPFVQAYRAMPEFANQKFYYTYTDGLQREVTVSVNNDVQNVLHQLEMCP